MKTTKLLICAISVAAALASARSHAQSLSATLVEINPGLPVGGTFSDGALTTNYPSGVFDFTDFEAFCVEPSQSLLYGETLVYQVQDINLLANYDKIARLVGGYLASSRSNEDAAAVHWAIWETTSETLASVSLLNGNVRITTPVNLATAKLANEYLANVASFSPATLSYLTNGTRQDVVTWNLVPEPGSLGLLAFSAVLFLRRRR